MNVSNLEERIAQAEKMIEVLTRALLDVEGGSGLLSREGHEFLKRHLDAWISSKEESTGSESTPRTRESTSFGADLKKRERLSSKDSDIT